MFAYVIDRRALVGQTSPVQRVGRGAARASLKRSVRIMSHDPHHASSFPLIVVARERREGPRRRVRLRTGRALDAAGRFICEATIVDLSAHGARLRLADPTVLPDTLWLFDEAEGRVGEGRVVRRTAREAGLSLTAWRKLDELPPATRRRLEAPYYAAD